MPAFLLLLAIIEAQVTPLTPVLGTIEATIHGTSKPLDVVLLLRDGEAWKEVDRKALASATRAVRFARLSSGVYQVLVRGLSSTEQLATKVVIGRGDMRRVAIAIDPVTVIGRVTIGGSALGPGVLSLRHKEFHWRAVIGVASDGSFRIPVWQRGTYSCRVRGAAITMPYASTIEFQGASPIRFLIDIPDGRITGVVRDAKTGEPVNEALVALETQSSEGSQHVNVTTDDGGRFAFNGMRFGRYTLRVISPRHLEPSPIVIDLDSTDGPHALNLRLESGRAMTIVVMDADDHPVANATVFAVADARRRSRATTDEKGATSLSVPENEAATLIVVPPEGAFGVTPLAHAAEARLTLHLSRASSSLRIRARTRDGKTMPAFSLLMRYNGELIPLEVADELTVVQGLQFAVAEGGEAYLQDIPGGMYEFWPYRTKDEVESIIVAGRDAPPPIQVDVRNGVNAIEVTFAAR